MEIPDKYIPVKVTSRLVADPTNAANWNGEIDITGAFMVTVEVTAGEVLIDGRQVVKVVTDSSGTVYPTAVTDSMSFPYVFPMGAVKKIERNPGYASATAFLIKIYRPAEIKMNVN